MDKFIEVKSYSSKRLESNKPYFFWSANEADVASQEKNNYYLYIQDGLGMTRKDIREHLANNRSLNILNDKLNNNYLLCPILETMLIMQLIE